MRRKMLDPRELDRTMFTRRMSPYEHAKVLAIMQSIRDDSKPKADYHATVRLMCPVCANVPKHTGLLDPITGMCDNTKQCEKRRAMLDQETIDFYHLVTRSEVNDSA